MKEISNLNLFSIIMDHFFLNYDSWIANNWTRTLLSSPSNIFTLFQLSIIIASKLDNFNPKIANINST